MTPSKAPARAPEPAASGRWRSWLPFGLALVLVPLVFYWQMVFLGWEPPAPDTEAVAPFGAWGKAAEQEIGRTPSWYPYIFSGMPSYGSFLYTPRSVFNPIGWLVAPFGQMRGVRYLIFAIIAGAATCALARRQGPSRLASTTAGLLYALTPYSAGNIAAGHATKLEALALVPLFLLTIDFLLSSPGLLAATALGLSAALLLWAHHPQVAFYAFLLAVLFGVGRLIAEPALRGRGLPGRVAGIALAAALALLLVAEPYLAVFEYAPYSIRGGGAEATGGGGGAGWDYATAWSFHPQELISFLFPGWFGLEGQTYWGLMPFTQSTHYFGVVALLLAIVGLVAARGARRWIWGGLSAFVLVVGFGRHLPLLYGPMFHFLPYFDRFRVPSMIYGVLPLVLAPLIAAGIDSLAEGVRPTKKDPTIGARLIRFSPALVITGGIGLLLAFGLMAAMRDGFLAGGGLLRESERARATGASLFELQSARWGLLRQSVLVGLGWLTLLFGWLLFARRSGATAARVSAGLAALALLDALAVGRQFHHPEPRRSVEATMPVTGAIEYLKAQTPPFRILPLGEIFGSNAFGRARLESLGGYHPAKLRAYQDLLTDGAITSPGILRALDVRYVVSASPVELSGLVHQEDGFVYELPPAPGRAWAVERATLLPDEQAVAAKMRRVEFDPAREALFTKEDAPAATTFAPARVTLSSRRPDGIDLRVEAEGAAFVVVSEIHYPPGWSATIDGAPARMRRVDHLLMGTEMPAGDHLLALTSRDQAQSRGELLARIGAALAFVCAMFGLWRARSASRVEPQSGH